MWYYHYFNDMYYLVFFWFWCLKIAELWVLASDLVDYFQPNHFIIKSILFIQKCFSNTSIYKNLHAINSAKSSSKSEVKLTHLHKTKECYEPYWGEVGRLNGLLYSIVRWVMEFLARGSKIGLIFNEMNGLEGYCCISWIDTQSLD